MPSDVARRDLCKELNLHGNTLHSLERESGTNKQCQRYGRHLTGSRNASQKAKTVYSASAETEPKPDMSLPWRFE